MRNVLHQQYDELRKRMFGAAPRDQIIGLICIIVVALILASTSLGQRINAAVLDLQFAEVQATAPVETANLPVLIGIDEQSSSALPEPTSLWHFHLAKLFSAVAEAKPSVVGLQMNLPVRSYAFIAPGYDKALADGLSRLTSTVPVIIGQSVGNTGRIRQVFPELINAAGNPPTALTSVCPDKDAVVRDFELSECTELAPLFRADKTDSKKLQPLALSMAQSLGYKGNINGLIDYGHGGQIRYVPLIEVLKLIDAGDKAKLNDMLAGRPLLIGTLVPTETRYKVPVPIAGWEPGNHTATATLIQYQTLRNLLNGGMVAPVSAAIYFTLLILSCLFWLGRSTLRKLSLLAVTLISTAAISLYLLHNNTYLPAGMLMLMASLSYLSRYLLEHAYLHRERGLLKQAFAHHVSPASMREILRHGVPAQVAHERQTVVLLYANIKGFNARCDTLAAKEVFTLLNQFFGDAAAAVHSYGGMVDKLVGDGLLAAFGLPVADSDAARHAIEAAQDLLLRVDELNLRLRAQHTDPVSLGISLHAGSVAAGYVETRHQRNFALVGETISQCMQIERLCQPLQHTILLSDDVALQLGGTAPLTSLGQHTLANLQPITLWGWRPEVVQTSPHSREQSAAPSAS